MITHVSPSLAQILGIPQEDIWVFERWLTHIHPSNRAHVHEALERSFSPPFSFDETIRYNHPERGPMWLHVQAQGIPAAEDLNRLDFANGVLMDVTQLKLVREQLEVAQW